MVLDKVHRLAIEFLDALPYLTVYGLVVGKLEPISPVAEVARENEDGFGVVEVFSESFSVVVGHLLVDRAGHDGDELDVFA
jgi:hypothetical protein